MKVMSGPPMRRGDMGAWIPAFAGMTEVPGVTGSRGYDY